MPHFTPAVAVGFASMCGTVSITIWTAARVYLRRLELLHGTGNEVAVPTLDAGAERRLERIEQAVEAIAIEVERVSEGQRFTTRLLSERVIARVPSAGSAPRVDTPH